MTEGKLTFRYSYDQSYFDKSLPPDDFGWLAVEAVSSNFSGRGGMWVQWQDIIEFKESLSTYPITANDPLVQEWGFNVDGQYFQIIKIDIGPKNDLGELTVNVEIADYDDPSERLQTKFRTSYPALDFFRRDMERLMSCEVEEASLLGH